MSGKNEPIWEGLVFEMRLPVDIHVEMARRSCAGVEGRGGRGGVRGTIPLLLIVNMYRSPNGVCPSAVPLPFLPSIIPFISRRSSNGDASGEERGGEGNANNPSVGTRDPLPPLPPPPYRRVPDGMPDMPSLSIGVFESNSLIF